MHRKRGPRTMVRPTASTLCTPQPPRETSMRVGTRSAATGCAVACLLSACASPLGPPAVPDALKVGANESLTLTAAAKGVQIYECRAGKESGAPDEWAVVAPEAELFDARGNRVGQHGA